MVYRDSEVERLVARARQAEERVDQLRRAQLRLAGVDLELEDLMLHIAQLELRVEAEQADVDELRSGGLRALLLKLVGQKGPETRRQEEELFEAALAYEAAIERRAEARRLREQLHAEIAGVRDAHDQAEHAFGELERYAAAHPESVDLLGADMVELLRARRVEHAPKADERLEQLVSESAFPPPARWVRAMRALRAGKPSGSSRIPPTYEQAIEALEALRAQRLTLWPVDPAGPPSLLSPRRRQELTEAHAAADAAIEGMDALRDAIVREVGAGTGSTPEIMDAVAPSLVTAQLRLDRFVREMAEAYLMYPLSGTFAETVLAALRAACDVRLDPDNERVLSYLREWSAVLRHFRRDLNVELG